MKLRIRKAYRTIVLMFGMLLITGLCASAKESINYGDNDDLVYIEIDEVQYGCIFRPSNKSAYIFELNTNKEEVQLPAYITYYGKKYRVDIVRELYYITDDQQSTGFEARNTLKKLSVPERANFFSIEGSKWKNLEQVWVSAKVKKLNFGGHLTAKVIIDSSNKHYKTLGNGVYSKNGKTLLNTFGSKKSLTVRKGTQKISSFAFNQNTSVQKIIMGNTIKTIEDGTKSDSAFGSCSLLREVVCSSNLEKIGKWSFNRCKKLSKVVLNNTKKAPQIAKTAFNNTKAGIRFYVKNEAVGRSLKRELKNTQAKNFKIIVKSN